MKKFANTKTTSPAQPPLAGSAPAPKSAGSAPDLPGPATAALNRWIDPLRSREARLARTEQTVGQLEELANAGGRVERWRAADARGQIAACELPWIVRRDLYARLNAIA